MKKTLVISLACLYAFSIALGVHADEDDNETSQNTSSNRPEKVMPRALVKSTTTRAQMEEKREALKNEIESRKENLKKAEENRKEIKEKIEEKRKEIKESSAERVTKFVRTTATMLNNALDRLVKLREKIDDRLVKLEERGGNTTTPRASLVIADEKISLANKAIESILAIPVTGDTSVSSTTTPVATTTIATIKNSMRNAQSALRDAQKALMKVVSDMRGIQGVIKSEDRPSTSTPTTTNTTN